MAITLDWVQNVQIATGKQTPGPHYDLEQFKVHLRADNFHVYKGRALDVVQRLRKCGRGAARDYIRDVVLSLERGDYAHSLKHPNGQVQDLYGKLIRDEGWYLKIEINLFDDQPGIVSCHPAEYDLRTRRGTFPRTRRPWL